MVIDAVSDTVRHIMMDINLLNCIGYYIVISLPYNAFYDTIFDII